MLEILEKEENVPSSRYQSARETVVDWSKSARFVLGSLFFDADSQTTVG